MRHLEYSEDGFSVEWSLGATDSRLLNPTARLNLEAAGDYAARWFAEEEKEVLFDRLGALIADLEHVPPS
jgi:hypothetical protein